MTLRTVTPWPLEAIWQAVEPLLPGFSVEVLPQVDSTNAELMRRALAGRCDPCLLLAEQQTAGKGRLGRAWHGSLTAQGPGTLTFSLGLILAPKDWSGLSLAVGVSLAQTLHPDIVIKWPNDLWWRDRKLAGVLIETTNWVAAPTLASRYVVIGVGLNIQTPDALNMSTAPVGLRSIVPDADALTTFGRVVAPLVRALQVFEQRGFSAFQRDFNDRDALAQAQVTLSNGLHGQAQGVDAQGALLVQTAHGLQRVTSSEVSVRPVAGPDYGHL